MSLPILLLLGLYIAAVVPSVSLHWLLVVLSVLSLRLLTSSLLYVFPMLHSATSAHAQPSTASSTTTTHHHHQQHYQPHHCTTTPALRLRPRRRRLRRPRVQRRRRLRLAPVLLLLLLLLLLATPPLPTTSFTYSSKTHPFYSVCSALSSRRNILWSLKLHLRVFSNSSIRFWTCFWGGSGGVRDDIVTPTPRTTSPEEPFCSVYTVLS